MSRPSKSVRSIVAMSFIALAATYTSTAISQTAEWTLTCPRHSASLEQFVRQRSAWNFSQQFKAAKGAQAITVTLQNCQIDQNGVDELVELQKFIENTDAGKEVTFVVANCTFSERIDWRNLRISQQLIKSSPADRLSEPAHQQPILRKTPNNNY